MKLRKIRELLFGQTTGSEAEALAVPARPATLIRTSFLRRVGRQARQRSGRQVEAGGSSSGDQLRETARRGGLERKRQQWSGVSAKKVKVRKERNGIKEPWQPGHVGGGRRRGC